MFLSWKLTTTLSVTHTHSSVGVSRHKSLVPGVDQELYFRRRLIFGTYSFCSHRHDECRNGRKKTEYQCSEGRENVHPACFSGFPRFRVPLLWMQSKAWSLQLEALQKKGCLEWWGSTLKPTDVPCNSTDGMWGRGDNGVSCICTH